jgi:hypothetical protein
MSERWHVRVSGGNSRFVACAQAQWSDIWPNQKNPPIFRLNLGKSPGRGGKIGSNSLALHTILTPRSDDDRRLGPVETPFRGGVSLLGTKFNNQHEVEK